MKIYSLVNKFDHDVRISFDQDDCETARESELDEVCEISLESALKLLDSKSTTIDHELFDFLIKEKEKTEQLE